MSGMGVIVPHGDKIVIEMSRVSNGWFKVDIHRGSRKDTMIQSSMHPKEQNAIFAATDFLCSYAIFKGKNNDEAVR